MTKTGAAEPRDGSSTYRSAMSASLADLAVGVALIFATLHRPTLDRVLVFMRYTEHVPFWSRISDDTQDRVMRCLVLACGVVFLVVGVGTMAARVS
jgi:hypothetical protein